MDHKRIHSHVRQLASKLCENGVFLFNKLSVDMTQSKMFADIKSILGTGSVIFDMKPVNKE